MRGIRRILVFCTLTTILPIILLITPLYLRHNFYANVAYAVTDSDILEISDGISPIFCSGHTLQMNRTFNAFQMAQKPAITSYRKHIRLKKNMTLPDDTLEYWGFYLLKGATVALSVCSRFQGASILVVKGERNLQTCGMLEHHNTQVVEGIFLPEAKKQVKVIFQLNTEEVSSNSSFVQANYNSTLNELENTFLLNYTMNNKDDDIQDFYSHVKGNIVSSKENCDKKCRKLNQTENILQAESKHKRVMHNARKLRHARKKQFKEHMKGNIITRHKNRITGNRVKIEFKSNKDVNNTHTIPLRRLRRMLDIEEFTEDVSKNEINIKDKLLNKRRKRNKEPVKPTFLLDQGIKHGGNAAKNSTVLDNNESSTSSFENELFKCYGGSILIAQEFAPSEKCTDIMYLLNGKHMQAIHNVVEDGYYYYIFYSDNDIVSNDLYALFDIYKPVFRYENVTKSCLNETECSFSINLLSSDMVIVEIPTKNSIENGIDDVNLLLSICHPRMEVYIIFPIAVLFFILTCAFM